MKKILFSVFLLLPFFNLFSQQPNCYRLYLTDKNDSPFSVEVPQQFLSQRAIDKRERFAIPVIEEDLPVSPAYIQQIKSISSQIAILSKTKWFNTVTIYCPNNTILSQIENLPFVREIIPVAALTFYSKNNSNTDLHDKFTVKNKIINKSIAKAKSTDDYYNYGAGYDQISMHNAQELHNNGFRGDNMLIAVLDAGWNNFQSLSFAQRLYNNQQIKGTKDLIPYVNNVYTGHGHGTAVTSTMASMVAGVFVGTAPEANYYFIRSEHPYTEQLIEEDFWAEAAEIADSIGADVINSSLGYRIFDDFPQGNWTYASCDGETSIASLAATKATLKGIITCVSAGNDGDNNWHYIGHPADAFNILAVGALYPDSSLASFSSRGPSYDGRVKPDIMSTGAMAVGYVEDGSLNYIFGTSFAGPIMAGIVACLWQALPHLTPTKIMQLVRENSSNYNNPDESVGYGIPNVWDAYNKALSVSAQNEAISVNVFPVPAVNFCYITNETANIKFVLIFDTKGTLVKEIKSNSSSLIQIDISGLKAGIYFGKAATNSGTYSFKIVKL